MFMLPKFVLLAVSVTLSLNKVYANNGNSDSSTCVFSQPGNTTCPGTGITSVAKWVGDYLNGDENYALIFHPIGIYIIINVDFLLFVNELAQLISNGCFGYVLIVKGRLIAYPVVGCAKPYFLTKDTKGYFTGARTLQNEDLYKAIQEFIKFVSASYSCGATPHPCSVLETTTYGGPSRISYLNAANIVIDFAPIQFVSIRPQNGTESQFANGVKTYLRDMYITDIRVMKGSDGSVTLTLIKDPEAKACKPFRDNIFPKGTDTTPITSMKSGSACYAATYVGEVLAACSSCRGSRGTYVIVSILKRRNKDGNVLFDAYIRSSVFDELFYALFGLCK